MAETLSYFDVKSEYDAWQGNKERFGLGEYAQRMDALEGSQRRQKAYNPGIATTINAYIDKAFSPISEPLRPVGEAVGEVIEGTGLVSDEFSEKAGDVAVSLPRTIAEFAPWFAPAKAMKGVQAASAINKWLKPATAGSAFVRGTSETGTPVGGAIQAAMLPAFPAAARAAEGMVANRLAKGASPVIQEAIKGSGVPAREILAAAGQATVPRYLAGQAGIQAAATTGDVAQQIAATGSIKEGLALLGDADYWGLNVIGQVPFLGLDAVRLNAEIAAGRKVTEGFARQRAEMWDSMVIADSDARNTQLDELSQKLQTEGGLTGNAFIDGMRRWKSLAPTDSATGKHVSPKVWRQTNDFRYKSPEDVVSLTRAWNQAIIQLQQADALTRVDIFKIKDSIFGEGPVTAEKLQSVFDGRLAMGEDPNQATLRIVDMLNNRLGELTSVHSNPLRVIQEGEVATQSEIAFNFPSEPNGLRPSLRPYAERAFRNSGYEPDTAKLFARAIERTVHLFDGVDDVDIGVIRNAVQDTNEGLFKFLGLYAPKGTEYMAGMHLQQRMIALLDSKVFDNEALDKMYKIGAVSHELFHARFEGLKKEFEAGTIKRSDRAEYLKQQKLLEQFRVMSVEERLGVIQQLHNVLIPEEYRTVDGARDKNLTNLEIEAARTENETVAVLSQLLSLGVLSPAEGLPFRSLAEALKWAPDEVSEFANMHYRHLSQFVDVLNGWHKSNRTPSALPISEDVVDSIYNNYKSVSEFLKAHPEYEAQLRAALPPEIQNEIAIRIDPIRDSDGRAYLQAEYQLKRDNASDAARALVQAQRPEGRPELGSMLKGIQGLMKTHQQVLDAQQTIGKLLNFIRPEDLPEIDLTYIDKDTIKALGGTEALKNLKEALGIYADKDLYLKKGFHLGNIERLLGNPAQFAKLLRKRGFNSAAKVIESVQDIPSTIEKLRTTMLRPFLTISRAGKLVSVAGVSDRVKLTPVEQKVRSAFHAIVGNEKAHAAFSDIALLHNEFQRKLGPTDPGFVEAVKDGRVRGYNELDDNGKSNVWHMVNLFLDQNHKAAQIIKIGEMDKISYIGAARLLQENPRMSTEAAERIMNSITKQALASGPIFLKQPMAVIDAVIAKYKSENQEISVAKTAAFLQTVIPAFFKMSENLDNQASYYFTERRIGDYLVNYKRSIGPGETEVVTTSARDRKHLREVVRGIENDPTTVPGTIRSIAKKDMGMDKLPIHRDRILEAVKDVEQALYEDALKTIGEKEANKVRSLYEPLDYSIDEAKKAKLASFLKPRQLRPGREYIDMFEAGIEYYNAIAYKYANDHAKLLTDLHMRDPQMDNNPDLARDIQTWADNLTQRRSREYHMLKNGIFSYFLGYNPSSMLIESMQSFITTTPMIVEETGSIVGAHRLLGSSFKELGKAYFNARQVEGENRNRLMFDDPELTRGFNQAIAERIMEYGSIEELSTPDEVMNVDAVRLKMGQEFWQPKDYLMQPLHWFSKFGRGMYSAVSGMNAKLSYVIGFKLAKQRGLNYDQAHAFAKNFIRRTTHSGGEFNRAIGFSKIGKAQSSASVLYTLNNFTFATLHMASRLVKDSLAGTGLTKAEKVKARKALATMATGQFVLAGAFGMPLAGAMVAIMEEIMGEPVRDDVRTALASLSGDTELGSMFADVAMRGFPTLLGVDAQSRFGLGSVLGFSEYQGFDATGFFGASGGIVENMYDGLVYGAQGEYSKAVQEAVPQAFKRPIEFMRTKGKYLDAKGELLVDPTMGEQFAYLIGFRPKRFSDIRLLQQVNRSLDDHANKERRQALGEIVDRFNDMSPREIRARIKDLKEDNPLFQFDDEEDITNRLVEMIMERQLPVDPNRSGSYASLPERERFAQTMPQVTKQRISEQQRLQLKNALKGLIQGRPERLSRREVSRAQAIDRWLLAHPEDSVQRARLALEQQPFL